MVAIFADPSLAQSIALPGINGFGSATEALGQFDGKVRWVLWFAKLNSRILTHGGRVNRATLSVAKLDAALKRIAH